MITGTYTPYEEIVSCPSELRWDKQIHLSTNAINLMCQLLNDYDPEPWECGLVDAIKERLVNGMVNSRRTTVSQT